MLIDTSLYLLASFVLGTILGSFGNVFVLRYGTGRSLNGRSSCGSCGKKLSWYELIPVVSWVIQQGRCRSCESRISPQYLIVELVFGMVFALCAWFTLGSTAVLTLPLLIRLIYLWVVSFLLLSISIYDVRHMIIPDGMLAALAVLVLGWRFFEVRQHMAGNASLYYHALRFLRPIVDGLLVALPFFALWFISRGRWMGLGDIKFAVLIGWMLGLLGGFSALIFGVWAGALVSLVIIGITRLVSHRTGLTMKSEIPFGPFLAGGALFVLLTHITMLALVGMM